MSRKISDLVSEYLESMDIEIHGSMDDSGLQEGDITVFGDGKRLFDTFDDYLAINPSFLRTMEGLFGENAGNYISNWFSNYFDYELSDWGEGDFYDSDEEEDY